MCFNIHGFDFPGSVLFRSEFDPDTNTGCVLLRCVHSGNLGVLETNLGFLLGEGINVFCTDVLFVSQSQQLMYWAIDGFVVLLLRYGFKITLLKIVPTRNEGG